MLPVDPLNALKAYTLEQKSSPSTASDTVAKQALQLEIGQKLQGIVQAQVTPNVFRVNVAGQTIQMKLPATVRNGNTLTLQVVATQPRLAFSIYASDHPLSTPEQLGPTAQLLSALSQQAPEKAYILAMQSTPLWDTPRAPEGKQLAGLLREALGNSGLFYESHQAQWLEGSRSTAQLMSEPQNLVHNQDGNAPNQPTTVSQSDEKALNIPPRLQPLVQQQINALETHHVLWHGNIWPGQNIQWEIHEQSQQASSPEDQLQWITQIHLDLPRLGTVIATMSFSNAGLNLTLKTSILKTRTMLDNACTQLLFTLEEAGIHVLNTQVIHELSQARS